MRPLVIGGNRTGPVLVSGENNVTVLDSASISHIYQMMSSGCGPAVVPTGSKKAVVDWPQCGWSIDEDVGNNAYGRPRAYL